LSDTIRRCNHESDDWGMYYAWGWEITARLLKPLSDTIRRCNHESDDWGMYYAWGWEITARLLKPFNAEWSFYIPLGTTFKICSLPA